jgi:hypothetical protein
MRPMSARLSLGSTVAVLFLSAMAARGDDWPQYRKDAGRSAASTDPVKFPLTDVWSWTTRGNDGHTPLYHVSVAKGRAYFIARDGAVRFLVCTNAKSGTVIWKRPLTARQLSNGLSDIVAPAVSSSGLVFAYDFQAGKKAPTPIALQSAGRDPRALAGIARDVTEVEGFVIRAFDAGSGQPLDMLPIGMMGVNGVLPRLALMHTGGGENVHPVPPSVATCPP